MGVDKLQKKAVETAAAISPNSSLKIKESYYLNKMQKLIGESSEVRIAGSGHLCRIWANNIPASGPFSGENKTS